jgi:predicted transcriptional regulator
VNIEEFKRLTVRNSNLIRKVPAIGEDANSKEVLKNIEQSGIPFAVIVEKSGTDEPEDRKKLKGVLSTQEIVKTLALLDPGSEKSIGSFVTKETDSINPDQTLDELRKKIGITKRMFLPVVRDDGTVEGIVSADDVRKKLAEEVTLEF